jgi:hypothetical protein
MLSEHRDVFENCGFRFEMDDAKPAGQRVKLLGVPFTKNVQFGAEG